MKIDEIKFNINEDLINTLLELLLIRQVLMERHLKEKDLLLMSEYYQTLKEKFIKLFKDSNQKEIELYKKLISFDK